MNVRRKMVSWLVALLAMAATGTALAHAALVKSEPARRATLSKPPPQVYPQLQSSGTEVIAIALPGATSSLSLPFSVVTDGAREAATAYLLFRRTLNDSGKTVLGESQSHMEFLRDRFGYARARWVPEDEEGAGEGGRDTQFLLGQIERIDREP